ncbi:MAG: hypothetical protein EOP56_08220 [Sphingobacteriales bacterium]|nr:MAG: hypothetical protein EOP56_08220 [Sphingobacteriales bacterium]
MANTSRFPGGFNNDNTSRIITNEVLNRTYAASVAINAREANTLVNVGQLTGALSLTIGTGSTSSAPYIGDVVRFLFSADGTGRVVTFSTGFQSAGNLTVAANKYGSASFMFNGATWVETGRTVTV